MVMLAFYENINSVEMHLFDQFVNWGITLC